MENDERNRTQNGEKSMALSFSICGILGLEAVNQVLGDTNPQSSSSEPNGTKEISGTNNQNIEKEEGNNKIDVFFKSLTQNHQKIFWNLNKKFCQYYKFVIGAFIFKSFGKVIVLLKSASHMVVCSWATSYKVLHNSLNFPSSNHVYWVTQKHRKMQPYNFNGFFLLFRFYLCSLE